MDKNVDDKISFSEFADWWLSGMPGGQTNKSKKVIQVVRIKRQKEI